MAQIHWNVFDEAHERFSNLTSQLESIRDILSADEDSFFNDEGEWTEKGVAALGTYIQEIEIYKNALADVEKELDTFKNPYAGNEAFYATMGIDSEQEYYDKLTELQEKQRDYTKTISDSEQSVVEMYESQIDAIEEYTDELIESYNDYIDVVKEALDAERDLYEFKKDIKKQTKDIATLERRIASLSGSDNAADIAERRKLEAELYDAKEGLNDTYYSHAKDQQSQALDDEMEAYETALTDYVESLRTKLDEATTNMTQFMTDVTNAALLNAGTIKTQYEGTGLALDAALINPWVKAMEKVAEFGGEKGLGLMNSWTTADGTFGLFATNATTLLQSPFTAGQNAVSAFSESVTTSMSSVYQSIQTNVEDSVEQLSKLASEINTINTTTVKPPITGGGDNPPPGGGDSGYNANVAALQTLLNEVFGEKLSVDGDYGPATTKAVERMQKAIGAKTSGKYDETTSRNLESYLKKMAIIAHNVDHFEDEELYKKHYRKVPIAVYAKGTMGTSRDEWALTDEIGDELVLVPGANGNLSFMRKGTSVVPADITANLVEWGKLNPDMLNIANPTAGINMISNAVNKPEFNLSFEALVKADKIDQDTLPEVKRFVQQEINSLVKQMNYAIKKFK